MDDCVFCKLIRGELPVYKVYEDHQFLAFLDIHPLNPGNSLLIPKTHFRWVTDVPNFGEYFEVAKKIALITQSIVKSDYTTFVTFGTDVAHAHIRIIPRFYNDRHKEGINTHNTVSQTPEEMTKISKLLFSQLSPDQP